MTIAKTALRTPIPVNHEKTGLVFTYTNAPIPANIEPRVIEKAQSKK